MPRDNPNSAGAVLLAGAGDLRLYRPDTTGFLISPGIYVMLQVGARFPQHTLLDGMGWLHNAGEAAWDGTARLSQHNPVEKA